MTFSIPLMCCEYRDVSLLTSFHSIQRDAASCDSTFTGSKYALCIQPSVLDLSVNAKLYNPCPIFSMFMYMVTADDRNSRRFTVSFPCHSEGILNRHSRPLSLYPPMPYSQASNHSVTDSLTNTMLLIGTPLVVTCWSNFIHSLISSLFHSCSR